MLEAQFEVLADVVRARVRLGCRELLPRDLASCLGSLPIAARGPIAATLLTALESALAELVPDGVCQPEDEKRLLDLAAQCRALGAARGAQDAVLRLCRAAGRRRLLEGRLPTWQVGTSLESDGRTSPIWSEQDVECLLSWSDEETGPSGVRVVVAPWHVDPDGVERHIERPIEVASMQSLGPGCLQVSAAALTFRARTAFLRVPLTQVRRLEMFADGVTVRDDRRCVGFVLDEGWFTAELLRLTVENVRLGEPTEVTQDREGGFSSAGADDE